MTGFSIRRLHIFTVLIMWGNYNYGVIYDEVKNTAALRVNTESTVWHSGRHCGYLLYYTCNHNTCGFGTRKDIHF